MTIESQDPYEQEIIRAYRRLLRQLSHLPKADRKLIRKAFEMAREAHASQKRKSGEPYILHPLEVARIVAAELGIDDPTSIICALLHDVVEDTEVELEDIQREFGNKAMHIINGLTKISTGPGLDAEVQSKQAETFRKILLTISDDIRVVLVKLADRLHNMRTMGAMREEKMRKITAETLYIYAPLAHRLGLYEIKTELEDLSFRFSNPQLYQQISEQLENKKKKARRYISRFVRSLKAELRGSEFSYTVKSRFKSIYSIYSKMQRKNLPFEEIFDIYAIRIILKSSPEKEREDCWRVYSLISNLYRPNPKRLRDWITVPKENGYESLHTTLMGPEGQWVEVQIRTTRMDDIAEKGIAAHWKYKEDGSVQDALLTEWIGRIRDILQNPDLDALEAVTEFKARLTPEDVFAYTPKGELVRLPFHSTALDFAYKIHTNIGHTAIGAKINTHTVPLDTQVRPGDQVEIINSKKIQVKEDWLRIVKTHKAKDSIRAILRKRKRRIIDSGRELFLRGARPYNIDETHHYFKELLAYFVLPDSDSFFYKLGKHTIDMERIQEFIRLKEAGEEILPLGKDAAAPPEPDAPLDKDTLVLTDKMDIDKTALATCCTPIPGDEILGFHQGEVLVIHRTTCVNAIKLMAEFGSRIVNAKWHSKASDNVEFLVAIRVTGLDKQGMLIDLIRIISQKMKLNMRGVTIESHDGMFDGLFRIYVGSSDELTRLVTNIKKLQNVYSVGRVDTHQETTLESL